MDLLQLITVSVVLEFVDEPNKYSSPIFQLE